MSAIDALGVQLNNAEFINYGLFVTVALLISGVVITFVRRNRKQS